MAGGGSHEPSIGRLGSGACVAWREDGQRRRYCHEPRERQQAGAMARDACAGKPTPPNRLTPRIAGKPIAKSMGLAGRSAPGSAVNWAGGRLGPMRKGIVAAAGNADLDGISPQVLRHKAAVHLAEAGQLMADTAQRRGHSDSRRTAHDSVLGACGMLPVHGAAATALGFARPKRTFFQGKFSWEIWSE